MTGEVVVDVDLQPRRLSFGQVSKRAETTRELTLKVPEPDRVKITSVTLDDDRFALKLKSGQASGDSTYEVTFKGSPSLGNIDGHVRVAFTGSDVDHVDVPLWGQIVGDLRYPANLPFYKQKESYPPRKLTLTSRTKQPVHLLGVEDLDHHLEVKVVQPKGDAAIVDLAVTGPGPTGSEPVHGKLRLKTTDRDEPEVTIEYAIHPAGQLGAMRGGINRKARRPPPNQPAEPPPAP